jgi:hypothetical protein
VDDRRVRDLVDAYVAGWRDGDRERILSVLTEDCEVIESHGPIYGGEDAVARWVDRWNADGSRVERWEVTSFSPLPRGAVYEWSFACTVARMRHELDGVSLVEVHGGRIVTMREYRRTAPPFELPV